MKLLNKSKKYLIPMLIAAAIFIVFKLILFIGYVPTSSMEPTLSSESLILGYRAFKTVKTGDIIVFRRNGRLHVKRVAAGPKEIVDLDALDYITGLEQCRYGKITVPENCYFVLGDNSSESYDSRYWDNPFVLKEDIVCVVIELYYPYQ